ncbi:MAG: hypothetical protein L3J45_05930 [Flavobacteriaceae bacterium]|nr:hypothetical protein [Flavobacteriaceae bacterium]
MHYLIIGISIIFLSSISSCSKQVEYRLDTDIIYKNETNHFIKYYELIDNQQSQRLLFELPPNSEKKIEMRSSGSDTNINNCCQGVLNDFQGNNSILIDYDNSNKCLIYISGEGSTTGNISAYESREIESNYYEFIYRFTETEYSQAKNCN